MGAEKDEPPVPVIVADAAATAVAPGSVVEESDSVLTELREFRDAVLVRLDALVAAPAVGAAADPTELDTGPRDEPPIRKPWTHRTPWSKS